MTTTTTVRPYEVGKEAILVVGMEGVVEKMTADTITIGGIDLPYRFDHDRGIRYLSMVWPQDDPSNCDRDCCSGPVEDAAEDARDDLAILERLVHEEHEDRHDGPMRFCENAACREVAR